MRGEYGTSLHNQKTSPFFVSSDDHHLLMQMTPFRDFGANAMRQYKWCQAKEEEEADVPPEKSIINWKRPFYQKSALKLGTVEVSDADGRK